MLAPLIVDQVTGHPHVPAPGPAATPAAHTPASSLEQRWIEVERRLLTWTGARHCLHGVAREQRCAGCDNDVTYLDETT